MRSNIKTIFYPEKNSLRIPRKIKKRFKKSLFGFYGCSHFSGIYKLQKRWNKQMPSLNKVVRRGNTFLCKSIDGYYWKVIYFNNKIINKELSDEFYERNIR